MRRYVSHRKPLGHGPAANNGEQGQPVELDIFAYTESENTRPEPFKARFTPRSKETEQIILGDAEEAREALRYLDGDTKITMASVAR